MYLFLEEEDEELVREERDVEELVEKNEKIPYAIRIVDNLFKVSESVHMNEHIWMVRDKGQLHVQ